MMTRRHFALASAAAVASGAAGTLQAALPAEHDSVFARGPVNPYGKFFTGTSYLTMLSEPDSTFNCPVGNVTFEPGCRTFWHKHSGGQILLVLSGEGRYQERGKKAQVIKKGDVVRIAPDVEHWHGGSAKHPMTHISIETNVPNNKATWLEPVSDEEYAEANR